MKKSLQYIDINFSADINNLAIDQKTNIKIEIVNKSNIDVENGLFRLGIDTSIFNIVDDRFNACIDNFVNIGTIKAGRSVILDIPIQAKRIPEQKISKIFSYLNFHIIENDELVDLNYRSDDFIISFLKMNLIKGENFKITSPKDTFSSCEDIELTLYIKNTEETTIENILVTDYVPKNTYIVDDSLSNTSHENFLIKKDSICIYKLEPLQELNIKYKVSLLDNINYEYINVRAKLKYIYDKTQQINIESNILKLNIDNKIFNDDTFIYKIDKDTVFINDIITHTLKIKNNTNIMTSNLSIRSHSKDKIEFVENSLIINDIYRIGESIYDDIKLGELESNEEISITYKTKVKGIYDQVDMNVILNYDLNNQSLFQTSNTQSFKVISPIFDKNSFIKTTSKDTYSIGELINFTIQIINIGNTSAKDVVLKDNLCEGLEFINNSIYINNYKVDGDLFNQGILLDELIPNEKVIIQYKARAIDIFSNRISEANIAYSLKNENINFNIYSNEIELNVVGARIGNSNFIKELSSYNGQIGDIITSRIYIENTGTLECQNLKISEPINSSLEFIDNSLLINNEKRCKENIFNGINIDKICKGESIELIYQFRIIDLPKPNPIDDRAILSYTFINNESLENNTIYSSKTKLYVSNPNLVVIDKNSIIKNGIQHRCCHFNDSIFFNLALENKGNVGIENLKISFNFPNDLVIDQNSLKINNRNYNKDIDGSIYLPNLNVSQKIFIEFYAEHNFIEDYNLQSFMNIEYTFKDLKTRENFKKSEKFIQNIFILNPDIEINKSILDRDIEINSEFTKNINIKNTGNILLQDVNINLNQSELLKQSLRAVFINGVSSGLADLINIPTLDIGETIHISIRYKIENNMICENTIPESEVIATYLVSEEYNPILINKKSNKLKLDINNYLLQIKGKCSSKTLILDKTYTYMFNIVNIGNINCNLLRLVLNLPEYISYVKGSFCINGKNLKINDISDSIDIGPLNYNESINISFEFTVYTLPYQNKVSIKSLLYGEYENSNNKLITKKFTPDENIIDIEDISVDLIKSISNDYLQSGDILKIQTIVNNTGTINIEDLHLKDNEDCNLLFIEGSVLIDGEYFEDESPVNGINLKNLKSGDNILISYEYEYTPKVYSNTVLHFSELSYSYKFKDEKIKNEKMKSEIIYIQGALSTFKQFSIETEHKLNEFDPDIAEVVSVFTDTNIESYYEIDSIKKNSLDNSKATGKKVIVNGFVTDRVEYLTNDENSSLYMFEKVQPFTTFITLPHDYDREELFFKPSCDNIFYKSIGPRDVFVSSLISIEGLV